MFLLGSVLWETPRTGTERRSLLPTTAMAVPEAPQDLAEIETVGRRDADEYFAFGVELLLDGLERAR